MNSMCSFCRNFTEHFPDVVLSLVSHFEEWFTRCEPWTMSSFLWELLGTICVSTHLCLFELAVKDRAFVRWAVCLFAFPLWEYIYEFLKFEVFFQKNIFYFILWAHSLQLLKNFLDGLFVVVIEAMMETQTN